MQNHKNYSVNHRYDSKPHCERTVAIISKHLDYLLVEAQNKVAEGANIPFQDIFADTIIRCANDVKIAKAPEEAVLARFLELFRTTIIDYCFTVRREPLVFTSGNAWNKTCATDD
jgi:hypothetical protein